MRKLIHILFSATALSLFAFASHSTLSTLIELKKSKEVIENEINTKNRLSAQVPNNDEKAEFSEEIKG